MWITKRFQNKYMPLYILPFYIWRFKKCRSLVPRRPLGGHTAQISSDPLLSRWKILDCTELGSGGLTCELPVAPTDISKRKVTPLPVEGLILLSVSTQMASCSLGLIFENLGKWVACYPSVTNIGKRNPGWQLHSYFPRLVSHEAYLLYCFFISCCF